MAAKFLYVDINHTSGYSELRHPVEVAQHSRLSEDQQVVDHLRVKPCPKTGARGSWDWDYSKSEETASAEPQPQA